MSEFFATPYPDSVQEHEHYENSMERRQEAMGRYRRQQFDLFELDTEYPECPNCTGHGKPMHGLSADEEGCSECVR